MIKLNTFEHVYRITAAITIIIWADERTKNIIIGTPIHICKVEHLMNKKHGQNYQKMVSITSNNDMMVNSSYHCSPVEKCKGILSIISLKYHGRGCKGSSHLCWDFWARVCCCNGIWSPRGVHVFRPLPATMVTIWITNYSKDSARDARCLEEVVSAPSNCI